MRPERLFHFFASKKVLKFQHFKGLAKFLHFYGCISKHIFFSNFSTAVHEIAPKKVTFSCIYTFKYAQGVFSATPNAQGQTRNAGLRKAKHAAHRSKPSAAPRRRRAMPSASFICGRFCVRPRRPTGSIESADRKSVV